MNKIRLFKQLSKNGKEYYSFTTRAYKHEDSKLTWFVNFAKCPEPIFEKGYTATGKEYEYVDIDLIDSAFGNTQANNGNINPTITIFNYQEVKQKEETLENKVNEFAQDNDINPINIKQEDLPFYGG